MSCHSRAGVWLLLPTGAKKWHLPVDGQLIQFLTHDEGFGVVIQPSAVGVRQLGAAGTSILAARISYTVTSDTRQTTPPYSTYYLPALPIHDGPILAEPIPSPDPHRLFPIRSNPRRRFLAFSLRTLRNLMNGHVSGLEAGLRGGEQSSLYKAVIAGEGRLGCNRRISGEVRPAWHLSYTDISIQGWLFLSLVVSYIVLGQRGKRHLCKQELSTDRVRADGLSLPSLRTSVNPVQNL